MCKYTKKIIKFDNYSSIFFIIIIIYYRTLFFWKADITILQTNDNEEKIKGHGRSHALPRCQNK